MIDVDYGSAVAREGVRLRCAREVRPHDAEPEDEGYSMRAHVEQREQYGHRYVVKLHDCARVGSVELSDDWVYCPWCRLKVPERLNASFDRAEARANAANEAERDKGDGVSRKIDG